MLHSSDIQYLKYDKIDKGKWDKCISEAGNALIYAYSFYLDHMAKHWDALVFKNYQAVMPLTWKRKFGLHYLYQPAFTACLGLFGRQFSQTLTAQFIEAIPSKFKLIEISLNHGNVLDRETRISFPAVNYVLPLNRTYEELWKAFRENHQRNIQKSQQAGNVVKRDVPIDQVIDLNKQQMKKISSITDDDYDRFEKLCEVLSVRNQVMTYAITGPHNKLLSSCVFFLSDKRAYYILVGNHPESRATGASHALLDAFIRDHSGKDLVLDFEGSDIETLALFYAGFGATQEIYPVVRWNRLPWWLKWLK